MKRSLLIVFLMVCFTGYVYPEETQSVSLDSLIDEALNNNPQIQAAFHNWKAQEFKINQAKSLSDPMASYTYFGENVETRVGPQEEKYGISQKIPFPGKLSLRAKAQAKQAKVFKQKYEAVKREVIRDVKFSYFDIYWVDRAIQITEEEKTILESLEKVAQRKFATGASPQQDVIKAQLELSKLIDKILLLKQNRNSLVAKMNSILNRPVETRIEDVSSLKPLEFTYGLKKLHQMAKESRQELLQATLEVERAEYEKSLAKLDYLPDFTLGFDYIRVGAGHTAMYNDGQDAWMGMVAINIPIWFDRLSSQLKEKKSALKASIDNYNNTENSTDYEIEDMYFKITTYKDIISLYKTALLPQTEQAFEAAKTGYEAGKVDFLNWLDSERILLQTRLAYYKTIVDYQKSIAYLERVVGMDL